MPPSARGDRGGIDQRGVDEAEPLEGRVGSAEFEEGVWLTSKLPANAFPPPTNC